MTEPPRRIALLLELPKEPSDVKQNSNPDAGMIGLRRLLKCLLRSYGLKCLSIKRPDETITFRTESEIQKRNTTLVAQSQADGSKERN